LNDRRARGRALPTARYEIITSTTAFTGARSRGSSATGQEKVKQDSSRLWTGFAMCPFNDLDAVAKAVGPKTAAILLEKPIQEKVGSTRHGGVPARLGRLATSETVA